MFAVEIYFNNRFSCMKSSEISKDVFSLFHFFLKMSGILNRKNLSP